MTIPYPDGQSAYTINCSDSKYKSTQYIYENKSLEDFESYTASLEAIGMTKNYSNSFENAITACSYYGGGKTVYTYYAAKDKTIKLIVTDGEDKLPVDNTSYETTVSSPKVAQLGLGTSNGMSYVFTLADGSFLVYDGGSSADDAKLLYDYMNEQSGNSGSFIIAGWVITHAHADHYGAFKTFISSYSYIAIEKVFYNAGAVEYLNGLRTEEDLAALQDHTILKKDLNRLIGSRAELVRVHTGQTVRLRNASIDVLYTPEDYYGYIDDASKIEANDLSVVTMVRLGGKNVLMTGDMTYYAIEVLATYYDGTESILNCDILQAPHHGDPSDLMMTLYGSKLVNLMSPDQVFCPTIGTAYQSDTLYNKLNKSYILQDETYEITLNS